MADGEQLSRDEAVPPPGEPVHLPGPSYLPVLVAFGITLAIIGVVVNWVVCGIGVVITVYCIGRWVGQARQEMSDLPLEH
jgi:hypothetical protein